MANSSTLFLILTLSLWSLNANACYPSIISFGDSLADTGNAKLLSPVSINGRSLHILYPPYGETFFHEPTGRCSNGRLIIDFVAESLGLPLIPPSQGGVTGWGQGVNYAVASATAMEWSFFEERGVDIPTNASLGVQLGWFKESLPSFCSGVSDCKHLIGQSLVLMGEIGGNDYNHALAAGKSIDEIEAYVPYVINIIVSTVNELTEIGVTTIVIPGNLPIGCSDAYLTIFSGSNKIEYDTSTGCIIKLNKFAEYHNELLQTKLNQIRELHPYVNVIYADYYNVAMQFFRSPTKYGFTNGALKACCGGGGPFNYNLSIECAEPSSTSCDQPDTYANWDGLHLTEAAYKVIFKSVFEGPYTTPIFNSLCPNLRSQSIGASSSPM